MENSFIPHRQKHKLDSAINSAIPGKYAVYSIVSGRRLTDPKLLAQALDDLQIGIDRGNFGNGVEVLPA